MLTTLNKIKAKNPSPYSWNKLLAALGKEQADDNPLHIRTIIDTNGFYDALWCIQTVDGFEEEKKLYDIWLNLDGQEVAFRRIFDYIDPSTTYKS